MKPVSILVACALFFLLACQQAEIRQLYPATGFPRQIVLLDADPLQQAQLLWDAGLATEQAVEQALATARYFQIPAKARPGPHPLRLRSAAGQLSPSVDVVVQALSGAWPPPRIEETTIFSFQENADGSAEVLLLLSVANVDARATVSVDGQSRPAVLYTAIAGDYFNTHRAATYAYPVYHYGGLLVRLTQQKPGSTLHIAVENTDQARDTGTFTLPASAAALDSDNDGLPDQWEIQGCPLPGGGTLDLAALGCHPKRKDILVEVDWTAAGQPLPDIWTAIEAVFRQAPVLNPDGSAGIQIHIDRGQGGQFTQGGQTLPPHTTIDFGPGTGQGYVDFFACKNRYFDPARLPVFHYCIFGNARPNGASGRGEIRGNDCLVTLANFPEKNSRTAQIGTFLHELGHNLGLRHGGIDNAAADANETFKPNQFSAMNYRYQFSGIAAETADTTRPAIAVHSYSSGMRNSIQEKKLNEHAGIGDQKPIDFNGNGRLDNPASANTNADTDQTDIHFDYNEWGALHLNFRAPGSRWNNN
ncbi:MAG: hypothetical protein IT260_07015 [Saprospiraceae bacterium]|nr:hypothetical protein [Saprospiraceae bacterium]